MNPSQIGLSPEISIYLEEAKKKKREKREKEEKEKNASAIAHLVRCLKRVEGSDNLLYEKMVDFCKKFDDNFDHVFFLGLYPEEKKVFIDALVAYFEGNKLFSLEYKGDTNNQNFVFSDLGTVFFKTKSAIEILRKSSPSSPVSLTSPDEIGPNQVQELRITDLEIVDALGSLNEGSQSPIAEGPQETQNQTS